MVPWKFWDLSRSLGAFVSLNKSKFEFIVKITGMWIKYSQQGGSRTIIPKNNFEISFFHTIHPTLFDKSVFYKISCNISVVKSRKRGLRSHENVECSLSHCSTLFTFFWLLRMSCFYNYLLRFCDQNISLNLKCKCSHIKIHNVLKFSPLPCIFWKNKNRRKVIVWKQCE